MNKTTRYIHQTLFLFLVFLLLGMIVKESFEDGSLLIVGVIAAVGLCICMSFKSSQENSNPYIRADLLLAACVPLGAVVCYALNMLCDLGSVLAAGIVGVVASIIPYLNKESVVLKKAPAALYCGAFVGMSSIEIAPSVYVALAAGIIAGLFFLLSKNVFVGLGGKLGTIAFGGVVVCVFLQWLT